MNRVIRVSIALVASIVILAIFFGFYGLLKKKQFKPAFHKGMCYTTWNKSAYASKRSDASLEKLKGLNVEWIAILTTWYQDHCFATSIFPTGKTPSDESLKQAIEKAHSLGIKVMLKPHLDILSTEYGTWRGEIACVSEPDWNKWFDSYKNFMLHYAEIAQETDTEMFCIGTELTAATLVHNDKWREIIREVRNAYKGPLIYAANWSEEYLQIRFWNDLDYAGLDAYFPLSDKDKPTYDELMEGWKRWLPEIEAWQKRINKPVIFPEIGYCSSTQAARAPWEHAPQSKVDLELQVDCYRALMDTFSDKDWFYGVYWWNWGTSVRMGGKSNRGFTPQNKPAQDYVGELYKKRIDK